MNLKKLLSMMTMMTVVIPTSLTAVACNGNKSNSKIDKQIMKDITQERLKITAIDPSFDESSQGQNIIALLNDPNNGLASVIQHNAQTPKEFNPKLFSLDKSHIYYDKDKKRQVKPDDTITDGTTDALFFAFSYDGIKDEKLVEVDLTLKTSDQAIVNAINNVTYILSNINVDSKTSAITSQVTADYIKKQLPNGPKSSFNDKSFTLVSIINNATKKALSDDDLTMLGTIDTIINYNYGNIKNQKTKLTITVNATDQYHADQVKALLEKGIDGSNLSVKNTQQDALILLQGTKGIKDVAVLSFVNSVDANKHLTDGNNNLNINIVINAVTDTTTKAKITNVNKINPDDQKAVEKIKTLFEGGIETSNLTVQNTQADALKILQGGQMIQEYGATLSFVNPDAANRHLVVGDNDLAEIKIIVNTVTVTTDQAFVTDVHKFDFNDQKIAILVKALLEKGIDGSSLSVKNTQQDALNLLQHTKEIQGIAQLSFVDSIDANTHLVVGDNDLAKINITVNTVTVTADETFITGVQLNDQYNADQVKALLEKGIDGSILSVQNTQADALKILQDNQTVKEYGATLSFVNKTDANRRLSASTNYLNINIVVGKAKDVTKTALVVNISEIDYPDIQNAIKASTDKTPLSITITVSSNGDKGFAKVMAQLKANDDQIFKNTLSRDLKPYFIPAKLGLYHYLYNSAKDEDYLNPNSYSYPLTLPLYFYIGYNAIASTDNSDNGCYIKVNLTIVS